MRWERQRGFKLGQVGVLLQEYFQTCAEASDVRAVVQKDKSGGDVQDGAKGGEMAGEGKKVIGRLGGGGGLKGSGG